MKILFPVPQGMLNPHIYELAEAITQHTDAEVTVSLKDFWQMRGDYDIVHCHWPEALVNWQYSEESNRHLKKVLAYWKSKAKIVTTCHNLLPHNDHSSVAKDLYQITFTHSDAIIHMGEYSKSVLGTYYQNLPQHQVVIPHMIFTSYPNHISRSEARKILGIKEDAFVMLSFGMLRHAQEKSNLMHAFRGLKTKNKILLTPWWSYSGHTLYRQWEKLYYHLHPRFNFAQREINNEDVQLYFNAADFLFISRTNNINSGNLILGFCFGKVVVGPDVGNMGEILKATGNPLYEPNNRTSMIISLKKQTGSVKGQDNLKYAKQHWSVEGTSLKHYNLYTLTLSVKYAHD